MIIDSLAASFTPEEAYIPPRNVGGKYRFKTKLLTRSSFKSMMKIRNLSLVWWASVFSFGAVVAIFDLIFPTVVFLISFALALILHMWVTVVLVKVSNGLSFEEGKQIHHVQDGWFPDPWAFGEIGRMRLFENGKWTEQVRLENIKSLSRIPS